MKGGPLTSWNDVGGRVDVSGSREGGMPTSTFAGSYAATVRRGRGKGVSRSSSRSLKHEQRPSTDYFAVLRRSSPVSVYQRGESGYLSNNFGPYASQRGRLGRNRSLSRTSFTPGRRRVSRHVTPWHPLGVPKKNFISTQRNSIDDCLANCMSQIKRHEHVYHARRANSRGRRSAGSRLFELLAYEPRRVSCVARTSRDKLIAPSVEDPGGKRTPASHVQSVEASAVINSLWAGSAAKRAAAIKSYRTARGSASPRRKRKSPKEVTGETRKDMEGQDDINRWENTGTESRGSTDQKKSVKKELFRLRSMARETAEAVAGMRALHKKMSRAARSHTKLRANVAREEKESQRLEKVAVKCKDTVDRLCSSRDSGQVSARVFGERDLGEADGFLSNLCLLGQRAALRREKAALEGAVTAAENELVEKLAQKDRAGVLFGTADGTINVADIRKRNNLARSYFHCHLVKRSIDTLRETERQLLGKTKEAGRRINKLSVRVKEAKEILLQHDDIKDMHIPKHKLRAPPPLDVALTTQAATIFHLTGVPQ
ncbi:uncharacterized protein TEOVI_000176500 [Trypanosoma equiperdum]|uniref:Uncharacterized protein n=2 Tax=Trypanozoon TaxID=39700 RepID=Q381L2_TRYB2|nr:hypothetical protein, conserved [Trypanosoma brucei brucei TREU927]EAN80519.1 hypothetical protein, conserved [Trypanosoma brucei brucei TREU927]SCU70192.1 hypothetical protein, conserved [Trypanosoma equiperdum]